MDCQEIVGSLYLGSAKASKDQKGLKKLGITHIVNVSGKQYFPGEMQYHRCYMKDGSGSGLLLSEHIPAAVEFIQQAIAINGKVLVHCQAGMSRSPSIVLAFLIISRNMMLSDAFIHIKSIRPAIKPNIAFLKPLLEIELKQHNCNSCSTTQWPKFPR